MPTVLITNTLIIISSIPKYYINTQTSRTQTGTTLHRTIDTTEIFIVVVQLKIEYM